MNKSKLLIVEGNTNEENFNFDAAGCVPQSENFKLHIKKIDPSSRLFNKKLGGGVILDLGCYPISFLMLFEKDTEKFIIEKKKIS